MVEHRMNLTYEFTLNTINYNSAFCELNDGFLCHELAQLINWNRTQCQIYVLGVCLNMINGNQRSSITLGILFFQLNNEYMGRAFRSEILKKGPIYTIVALLYCGGCKLQTRKSKPCFME